MQPHFLFPTYLFNERSHPALGLNKLLLRVVQKRTDVQELLIGGA